MEWVEEEILKEKQSGYYKKIAISQWLIVLFLFNLGIIIFFGLKLTTWEKNKWTVLAEQNRILEIAIQPPRGLIFDRNNNLIAENEESFDLIADLSQLKFEEKEYLQKIINDYNLQFKEIGNKIYVKNLPREIALHFIIRYPNSLDLRIVRGFRRKYNFQESIGNLIGYLGFPDEEESKLFNLKEEFYIGKSGIEKYYENQLRGVSGKVKFERDTKQNVIRMIEEKDYLPGYNLKLTINAKFQEQAYKIMDHYMKTKWYQKGGLIALNPHTGEILVLISYPNFDPNLFIKNSAQVKEILKNPFSPLFNRIIAGLYAPGSVIKPVIAVAALEEKIIDPNKKIFANGQISLPNPYVPGSYSIFRDWKIHGWVDMRKAIANSVNVYFYIIGGGYNEQKGLGIYNIKKYLSLFGFGEKTYIDLPGEKNGFLPDPEFKKRNNPLDPLWRIGDTYNVSIGQGDIGVTPLQIALMTSALATNKIIQPFIVKEILDKDGKVIFKKTPRILKENLVKEENLKIVQEGMRMTVTQGTAQILNDLSIPIAGKSGTPQILGKKKLNAFFTGYAPYPVPEIVLTIFIEEVPEGSVAVLPLYKEIIKIYFENEEKFAIIEKQND